MSARTRITITIEIEVDAAEADALEPVEGFMASPTEADPPVPGILALGRWMAGMMAGDALSGIAPALDPAVGLIRVTVNPVDQDDIL